MAVLNLRKPHTARQVTPVRPPHPLDTEHQRARELADEVCRAFAARRFAEANRLRSALLAHNIDVRVIEPGEGVTP